jgi:hypothetical protein
LALREFTVGQLTAFCDEDPPVIEALLRDAGGLVERVPGRADASGETRWRVREPEALRRRVGAVHQPAGSCPDPAAADDRLVDARLLRAEETLLECAGEESPVVRRTMAATSLSYLRQYVAGRLQGGSAWWDVDLDAVTVDDGRRSRQVLDPSRIRVDAALARLTVSEATGDTASWELILRAAGDMGRLSDSLEEQRLRPIVDRFLDLVEEAAPATGAAHGSAPTRMLSAVAWRRVRAQVDDSAETASQELLPVLRWMEGGDTAADHGELYRVLGRLPDGRARILVYADLLQLLPRQFSLHPEEEVVPGALVDAVADAPSAEHLATCADRLRRGLLELPFGISASALIGQAVHVIAELAEVSARMDSGVAPRAARTRADLLTLLGAPVDRHTAPPAGSGRGPGAGS